MSELKFSDKTRKARRDANLSQTELAEKTDLSLSSIQRIENGTRISNLEEVRKIAQATGKSLGYFISEEDADNEAKELLKGSNFQVIDESVQRSIKGGNKSSEVPLLSWTDLYKPTSINPLLKKGANMFRVKVGDSDNDPDFKFGDVLDVNTRFDKEDERYYLLRDIEEKRIVLRQLKRHPSKDYLRTKNLKFEAEFNPKRFEFIGRVTRYEREL